MLLQYHNRMGMPLYYSPYTRTSSWGHQDVLANFTEEMQMGASLRSYNTSTTESDDEGAMCIVTDDTNNEEDIISVDDDGCENLICKWDDCERHFDSPDNLAQHVTALHATTTRGGQYFCCWKDCPRSDRGFNARYKMLVHVRTHTKEKPHKCSICDKRFSRAENLKIHLRSHSGERPYVCPVLGCNKAYSNSSDRFKHTKTHSTDRPYFCKIPGCNKRYTDPSSLRKHVKTFKHHTLSVEPVVKAQQQQQQEIRLQPDVVDATKKCTCSHECFEHLQKAEIFKLGHLLNKSNWGKLWDPEDFIKNNINHVENVNVDMDVPLDLSIHK